MAGRFDMQDTDPYRPRARRAFAPVPRIEDYQPTEEQRQAQIWASIAQMAASAPRPQGGRKTIHLGLGRALTGLAALNAASKTQGQMDPMKRYAHDWKVAEHEQEIAKYQDESERREAAEARANKALENDTKRVQMEGDRIANSKVDKSRQPYEDWRDAEIAAGRTPNPLDWQRASGEIRGQQKMEFHIPPQPRAAPEPPTSVQEYSYAKQNDGYTGTYQEWIADKSESTRTPPRDTEDPFTKDVREFEMRLRTKESEKGDITPEGEQKIRDQVNQFKASTARATGRLPDQRRALSPNRNENMPGGNPRPPPAAKKVLRYNPTTKRLE